MNKDLKISIVSPSFNQGQWIGKTIESLASQEYPNLELIIEDGGSTDQTDSVISEYQEKFPGLISSYTKQKDNGMYHAIDNGFKKATGDIMGWLNTDDILYPGALKIINDIFCAFPEIDWITGARSVINEYGSTVAIEPARTWTKEMYWSGDYKWIQQESTFWRADLYRKAGGYISQECKLAGDFELWHRFFAFSQLYSADILLGGFRIRKQDQKSNEQLLSYYQEVNSVYSENREYCKNTYKGPAQQIPLIGKIVKKIGHSNLNLQKRLYFNRELYGFILK